MAPNEKHFDEIKSFFEKDLGWNIRLQLQNKQYLIKSYLPDYPEESEIGYNSNNFEWGHYSFTHKETDIWIFQVPLHTKGDLIFYNRTSQEASRTEIELNLWIEILGRYYVSSDYFSFIPEGITVLNELLKALNNFDEVVLMEYDDLSELESLGFDGLTKLWPYNDPGNKMQSFISSHDYYSEIENIYRQIRYSIAQAKTYWHYANRHLEHGMRGPFKHYQLNITNYDRRYLDFCTFSIQSIYVFWERLALLIFQYVKPKKLNHLNLSFKNLFAHISKEKAAGTIKGLDTTWFDAFLKDSHSKLQILRHPLVHYKLDEKERSGSFLTLIYTNWLKNISNEKELEEMERKNKHLLKEIIELALLSKEGYDQSLKLILEYKSSAPLP